MLSPWLEQIQLPSHSQTHVLRHLPRLPPSEFSCNSLHSVLSLWLWGWLFFQVIPGTATLTHRNVPWNTLLFSTWYIFKQKCLSAAGTRRRSLPVFHKFKEIFWAVLWKSLFPDQRVLYLTKVPKPIWLPMVRTQTPDYTESGPSASVTWGWRANCALGWGSFSCFFYSTKKTPLALSPFWLLLFLALWPWGPLWC